MTDTVFIEINDNGWTNTSQANLSGFMTNNSDNTIFYLQADAQPSAGVTKGHRLQPGEFVNFSLVAPAIVWSRSVGNVAQMIVTPG